MLIEYKIKFEKDGLTITQRVEPNSSLTQALPPPAVGNVIAAKHLGASFGAGGDSGAETSTGGSGPESGPITILGPIIFGGSNGSSILAAGKGGDSGAETSTGGGPPAGAGGGGGNNK